MCQSEGSGKELREVEGGDKFSQNVLYEKINLFHYKKRRRQSKHEQLEKITATPEALGQIVMWVKKDRYRQLMEECGKDDEPEFKIGNQADAAALHPMSCTGSGRRFTPSWNRTRIL